MSLEKLPLWRGLVSYQAGPGPSSKRFVLVIAGIALSLSTIILSVAAVYGIPVSAELWAVTSTLAAMAGVSYVGKKEAPIHDSYESETTTKTVTLNEEAK